MGRDWRFSPNDGAGRCGRDEEGRKRKVGEGRHQRFDGDIGLGRIGGLSERDECESAYELWTCEGGLVAGGEVDDLGNHQLESFGEQKQSLHAR